MSRRLFALAVSLPGAWMLMPVPPAVSSGAGTLVRCVHGSQKMDAAAHAVGRARPAGHASRIGRSRRSSDRPTSAAASSSRAEEVAALEKRRPGAGRRRRPQQGHARRRRARLQRLLVGSRHEGDDAAHVAGGRSAGRPRARADRGGEAAAGRRGQAAGVPRRGRQRPRHRHLARSQHLRAVHHTRHARRDEPDRLQQQLPHHAEPRIRGHPDRDARRNARDPDRRPAARRQGRSGSGWEIRSLAGRATRWWSRRRTSPTRCSIAAPPRTCTWSSASRASVPARSTTASRSAIRRPSRKPWTLAIPYVNTGEDMFEYACHEGNYGMEGILSGAREEERAAAGGRK